jgi:hypothetical protein
MISMFLLSLLIVINVIGWLWPVLTHPIAVIIYICFFVLFAKSAYEASQK